MSGGLILYHHDAAPAAGKCKRVVWLALNAKYSHTSLAVRYLRAVVPGSEVLELTINHQLLAILDEIYLRRPQVLAISCYIWNIELVKKLLPLLPRVLPELVIVCGGPEVSYETAEFMRQFPLVQAVIRGEGEEVAARLAAQDWQFSDMPGLAWRDAAGELHEGRDVVVTDFAAVPFAYTAAELDVLKERILYYETSRGCPFSCSYCLSCATAGVRYLPLPRVMRELDTFVAHDVRQVKFVDRTFNAKKAHFLPILQHILAYPLAVRTNFHFEVAIDYLDEDAIAVLNAMPTSRVQLEIGIQSTNEQTLAAVSRVNHWEQIASHIRRLLAPRNIHLHVDLIIGLPGEGMASFHRSFNDVYALQTDMLQLGFLKFLKGAAMMALVPRYHYQYMDSAPYEVLSSDALSYGEIRWFHSFEAVFEYYYNAGRCRHTAAWLIDKAEGGDAFAFWQHFTDWWEAQGYQRVGHSTAALYVYLLRYAEAQYGIAGEKLDALLRYDALLADRGRIRPQVLQWNMQQYQSLTAPFWRSERPGKYVADYRFTNWRDNRTRYHIEVFPYDVTDDAMAAGETAVLFDYTGAEVTAQRVQL